MTSIIDEFSIEGTVGDGSFYWDTDRFKIDNAIGFQYFDPTYTYWGDVLNYEGVDSLEGHTLTITQAYGTGSSYSGNSTIFTHFAVAYSGSSYNDLTESDLIEFSGLTGTVGPLTGNILGILFVAGPGTVYLHYSTVDVTAIEKDELSPPIDECPCPAWNNYNGTEEICVTP